MGWAKESHSPLIGSRSDSGVAYRSQRLLFQQARKRVVQKKLLGYYSNPLLFPFHSDMIHHKTSVDIVYTFSCQRCLWSVAFDVRKSSFKQKLFCSTCLAWRRLLFKYKSCNKAGMMPKAEFSSCRSSQCAVRKRTVRPPNTLRSSQLRTSEDTVAQLHLGREGPGSQAVKPSIF